jgi:hypothetical protein
MTTALGCDRMTPADFMRLIGDGRTALGPTDRAVHNAFLLLADPNDVLSTLVFRVASGTQVRGSRRSVIKGRGEGGASGGGRG